MLDAADCISNWPCAAHDVDVIAFAGTWHETQAGVVTVLDDGPGDHTPLINR